MKSATGAVVGGYEGRKQAEGLYIMYICFFFASAMAFGLYDVGGHK